MAKIPPIPVEPFFLSKSLSMATPSVKGAVFNIILMWWKAGCPELPQSETVLMAMSQIRPANWKSSKDGIHNAVMELLPILRKHYVKYEEGHRKRSENAFRTLGIVNAERQRKASNRKLSDDSQETREQIIPVKPHPSIRDNQFQRHDRTQVLNASKRMDQRTNKAKGVMLDDNTARGSAPAFVSAVDEPTETNTP